MLTCCSALPIRPPSPQRSNACGRSPAIPCGGAGGWPVPLGYAAVAKKLAVVPDQAETVRMIFTRYLELGSVRALADDLEASGIRTRQRQLKDGRIRGGGAFGVGGLAHLLRNRRHRSGRDHRDDAHNWASLFLGRARATGQLQWRG